MKNNYTNLGIKTSRFSLAFLSLITLLVFSNITSAQVAQDFAATPTGTNVYVDMGSGSVQHILVNNMSPQTAPNAATVGTALGYQVTYSPTRMPSIGLTDGELFGAIDVTVPNSTDNDMGSISIDFTANPPTGGNNNVYLLDDPDGLTTLRFNPVVVGANASFSMDYIIHNTSYETSQGADDRFEAYLVNMADGTRTDLLSLTNDEMENLETWQTIPKDLTDLEGQIMQLVIEFDTNAGTEEVAIDNISFSAGTVMPDWPVCVEPTAPTVSQVPASICPGVPFRLNIAGELNNATQWVIYDDAAGTNQVGATSGTSFDFLGGAVPGTTYYVRGEGECASPGELIALELTISDAGNCTQDGTPGTSFEEPLGSSENYVDTGDPAASHELMNNPGQPTVNHDFIAQELGFTMQFTPTRSGLSGEAGLTDGDAVGVSNDDDATFPDGSQGLVLEDTDGSVEVFFSPVDLTELTDVTVSFDYFVNVTTYEASPTGIDAFEASIAQGSTPLEQIVMAVGNGSSGLPGLVAGEWTTLTYTITGNYTEPVQLVLKADFDAGTERILIDNVSFSSGTIVCEDTEAPVVSCPDPIMIDADENCEGVANFMATATDDCSSEVTITYSQDSGTAFPAGETTVTVTATDESDKSSMCTFTVTVNDVTPPTVNCPDPVSADAGDDCMAVATFSATATDNCTNDVAITYSQNSGTAFQAGETTVTVTATDDASLSSTCMFTVTVNDVTPPSVTCPDPISVDADDNCMAVTSFSASATDNCTSEMTISYSQDSGTAFNCGETTVTVTATDDAGLGSTCMFTVTVNDVTTCPEGDVELTSQAEVDAFVAAYPDCTEITGNLSIGSPFFTSNITSLAGLDNITTIGGRLDILNNGALTNLAGLDNITTVGSDLIIKQNTALTNIAGLNNINTIGEELVIDLNETLTNCAIESFCTYLGIAANEASIINNATGCNSREEVVMACNAPQCPDGNVILSSQAEVDAFVAAYPNCSEIAGHLVIGSTRSSSDITNLTGLNNIRRVRRKLVIAGNASLMSLAGLDNITTTGDDLRIENNDALTNLEGLNGVTTVGQDLNIEGNAALINLVGLDAFTAAGEDLVIRSNSALTSLVGLDAFTTLGRKLFILNNSRLTTCAIESICTYLRVAANSSSIRNNAGGCNNPNEVVAACSIQCPEGDVTLSSQAEVDAFVAAYPNCTEIDGILIIGSVGSTTDITNLEGLHFITSVRILGIGNNTILTSLTGLDNITILEGLEIAQNPALTNCAIENFCAYLDIPANSAIIRDNATGCNSREEVEAACTPQNFQCPDGNVTLSSQAEVDAFVAAYPNCSEIDGNLVIGSFRSLTDITNLAGLSNITTVGRKFIIRSNPDLTSLVGLDAVTTVGEDLRIENNTALTNFVGLGSIATVGEGVNIQGNDALDNLLGLGAFTTVGENLIIRSNAALTSLEGLDAFTTAGGRLYILDNPELTTCAIESVCTYLGVASNAASIRNNATDCNSREEVEMACSSPSPEENVALTSQAEVDASSTSDFGHGVSRTAPKGVTEITRTNIKLYPNPTTGLLQLRNVTPESVTVFTAHGRRVADYPAPGNTLDIGQLPTGIYYLSILTGEGRVTARVVKID